MFLPTFTGRRKAGKSELADKEWRLCPEYDPNKKKGSGKSSKPRIDGLDKFWKYFNELKDYNRTIKYVLNFLKGNEDRAGKIQGYRYAAMTYEKLKDNKKALYYYNKLLKIDDMNPDGYKGRGSIYKLMNKTTEAIFDYEMAVMLDSDNHQPHHSTHAVELPLPPSAGSLP